jgi:NAD(P)-dependent dehydrogenase (short-subunit alcohol dehydrogenase family)
MDLGLQGRVALVAGGSAGIGLAAVAALAAEGCHVALCGRDPGRLEAARRALGEAGPGWVVRTVQADVQSEADARRAVDETARSFGPIDVLVNNSEGPPFDEAGPEGISDEDWRATFEGKLLGYVRLMGLVLPGMKERRWGRVISVVGLAGREPSAQLIKAGLVNAALMNLTKSAARSAAPHGVLVTAVNPGFIRTPRSEQFRQVLARDQGLTLEQVEKAVADRIPLGRFGTAEEVAGLIAFLASERASYLTGVTIAVDGGVSSAV